MTHQRQSHSFRRALVLVLSVALIAPQSAFAQFGNRSIGAQDPRLQDTVPGAYPQAPGQGLDGIGRMDSGLSVPVIRQGAAQDTPGQHSHGAAQQGLYQVEPAPLPPNDFQKFVLESTGQALPLFGAGFFSQQGGNGFPATSNTPVSPDYRLGPGDELQIKGWGSVDIDVRAVVDRNGQINIPRVGTVNMAGVSSSQATEVVRNAVGRYYRDFQLSVTLGQLRGMTVYVVGQARSPGAYSLSSTSTLVSALFASGGPGPNGSLRHVQVKRGDRVVTELDLYDFLARGNKAADVKLQDGDTIVIPPAKGFVALIGKVATPAVYELAGEQDTIGNLLALAGGLPVVADPKRAYLERMDPTQKPARSVETFALDAAGLAKRLKRGDLLTVTPLSAEFGNAVTLRGNVDQPVRTPWRQGMTVRDLIPSKAYLMSRASVRRQNQVLLTEEEKRNATGMFSAQDGRLPPPGQASARNGVAGPNGTTLRPEANAQDEEVRDTADSLARRIGNLVDEVNMDYAVVERVDSKDVSVKLLPFNLGRALQDASSPDNLPLQPGDIVTVFSVNDVRVPQAKRQVFVRVEGEVRSPGIYQMTPGDGLTQLLEKAGGLTPDAYLFGAEFYREEVRQAQARNLGQLVRRMEAQTQSRLSASAASVSAVSGDTAGVARLRLEAEARAQEQALERLRNLKPTGRIMLDLKPEQATVQALPNLRLENLDRLVVPARPDFVYVLGSVNTESSMIYRPGRTVQSYLDQSGLTSGADVDEMFVMRADGSVLSKGGRLFGRTANATVQPGDLIVLPEKTDHESAWSVFTRNAKDITQIIYQFSLGAAAIKTLRD